LVAFRAAGLRLAAVFFVGFLAAGFRLAAVFLATRFFGALAFAPADFFPAVLFLVLLLTFFFAPVDFMERSSR